MARTITIDPVTRIEGHAKVLIDLTDDDSVESAKLIINELRGFERILVGMEAAQMPLITARICGVCPSAHHLAAVKAVEAAFEVDPPPAAKLQRELLYMGHFIHSHAVSLFALAGPDMIFGITGQRKKRDIAAVVEAMPDVAKKALRLRTLGQKLNELIGGRGIHPVTAVIGGMSTRMTSEKLGEAKKMSAEALSLYNELAPKVKEMFNNLIEDMPTLSCASFALPTSYMGTIKNGKVNFYDGDIRIVDNTGKQTAQFNVADYTDYIVERPVDYSYTKPVFLKKPVGDNDLYRVSVLARLNLTDQMETPGAQAHLQEYKEKYGPICHLTIMQLWTRLIELQYACEKAVEICNDSALMGEARVPAKVKAGRGVGHVEAPRGTLIHEFEIDDKGIVRRANLLVATQQNYEAINRSIHQVVDLLGADDESLLDGVEFAIRLYDPCLSCSTHAVGQMPITIDVRKNGSPVRQIVRKGVRWLKFS
ncbi:MAG: Ni/Fe hydrogenase subunit alpha [Deltaproteobacteria bacterium]|nr:Ni/Fe hydrogenase subunit alpha [Deltaproteobacteria bacterium]